MQVNELSALTHLSVPEKIIFLETLWDSIVAEADNTLSVPESHASELDRRFAIYMKNPGSLLSLEELQKSIEDRK